MALDLSRSENRFELSGDAVERSLILVNEANVNGDKADYNIFYVLAKVTYTCDPQTLRCYVRRCRDWSVTRMRLSHQRFQVA